jgi:hypothetical protein
MSTNSYAQAPRLIKTSGHTALYAVTNGAMSILKAAYAATKRFAIGFLDFAIEVQELRDATFKTFPYISHE